MQIQKGLSTIYGGGGLIFIWPRRLAPGNLSRQSESLLRSVAFNMSGSSLVAIKPVKQ